MKKLKRLLSNRISSNHQMSPPTDLTAPETPARASNGCDTFSRLEQVPYEIRHQILLAVDSIQDLHSLVRASPIYHEQYLPRRDFWLWHCLWLDLDRTLVEAYTVALSSSRRFRERRKVETIRRFISEYEARRSITAEQLFDLPNPKERNSIVKFHMTVVRPLIREYVVWTRGNFPALSNPDPLSKCEERRIVRGLYRLQLFCNTFGQLPLNSHGDSGRTLHGRDRLELFKTLEPWEVEEVACINMFADRKIDAVFDQVAEDFAPENPRFDSVRRVITPPGAFHIQDELDREYHRNGMVSLGLTELYTAIRTQQHSRHEELVELVAEYMPYGDSWIEGAISDSAQSRRRQNNYSDRDKAQDDRHELPFVGDAEGAPSLAWVKIWRGSYSNLFGGYIPSPLRSWGYVMWDADRLTASGGLALIDEQWGERYMCSDGEELDPRDDM